MYNNVSFSVSVYQKDSSELKTLLTESLARRVKWSQRWSIKARVWPQVSPDPESLSMLSSSLETGRIAFLSLEIPACFSPQEYTAHLISEFRLLKTSGKEKILKAINLL